MAKLDCYEILEWIETMAVTKRAYRSLGYEVPSGRKPRGAPEHG